MSIELPGDIAALSAPTKDDVAAIDAWAKTVHPSITVTWDEERAAPPRKPGRGESVEEMRAKDPGPPALTVRTVEKLTGHKVFRRVTLHTGAPSTMTGLAARVEQTVVTEQQEQIRKAHRIPLAVLESPSAWDYPELTAKHHDLMGTLCPESVANLTYVANERRLHELREIIKGDWKGQLVEAVAAALHLATNEETSSQDRRRSVLLRQAKQLDNTVR